MTNFRVTVQTTHGPLFISEDFEVEQDRPFKGLIKFKDNTTGKSFLVNMDHLIWIVTK